MLGQEKASPVFIDRDGIMRYADSRKEASFFGVNYTVPFAHAYRALGYLNIDHRQAIDRDVYHFARLGFNAYRIHIWDVEISDEKGNLIENDHLDLFDYLVYKLKERGIKVVITTMTNFGNGYPEKNQPTGGFSYAYGKCDIHDNPEAIAAQEKYISAFVSHVNPYTRQAYMNDPDIVGFEINNEPCHSGTQDQTRNYINRMLKALKKTGNRKPVFYNVSHNMQQIEAYYSTDVQGTTYQWYPVGLVAGRTRKGNFLPFVDNFHIPFGNVKGFDKKTKLVYEYDPADNLATYVHPAMVRSFRSAGFQWITQFAYDPIDMARYNTEYQTHYLNLAYTPQKAISMKIAAEVAYTVPLHKDYPKYPRDTVFEDFRVSYRQNLSELNRMDKFYYSNHTTTRPIAPEQLKSVGGYGNSPVIGYEGTGAYFLDELEEGLWRLEIMPDAVVINDPFAKASLKKEVVAILWNNWDMTIDLPALQQDFVVTGLGNTDGFNVQARGKVIPSVGPGVYLLKRKDLHPLQSWNADSRWGNIRVGEFVAPQAQTSRYYTVHQSAEVIEKGKPYTIEAQVAGPALPDSVIVYTDKISFWSERNPYYKMERTEGYTYRATIPAEAVNGNLFRYNIVVYHSGKQFTFPAGTEGNPLDWDSLAGSYWESRVEETEAPVLLFDVTGEWNGMEAYAMPEWSRTKREVRRKDFMTEPTLRFTFNSSEDTPRFFLQKYIGDVIYGRKEKLTQCKVLCLHVPEVTRAIEVGFVCGNGFTYKITVTPVNNKASISLSDLKQTHTALLPHSYPVFLEKYFTPDIQKPFDIRDIEKLEISIDGEKDTSAVIEIGSIWLE